MNCFYIYFKFLYVFQLCFLYNMQTNLGICPAGIAPSAAIYYNDSVKNNQFMIGKKEAENETKTTETTETASLGCLPPPLPACLPACPGWLV